MPPSDTFTRPSFVKVVVSFAIGLFVGVGIVLPAIRTDVAAALASGGGPIGRVIVVGVLGILVVSVGLFGFYRLSRW